MKVKDYDWKYVYEDSIWIKGHVNEINIKMGNNLKLWYLF
jgi:hypothetical protein